MSSTGPVTGSGEVQVITVNGDLADTFIVGLDGAYTGKTHVMQMLDIIISTHSLHFVVVVVGMFECQFVSLHCNNNNNNILYSSQREIKAVIRSHNKENISVILSHETHAWILTCQCCRTIAIKYVCV